jgi:hypothetical protein
MSNMTSLVARLIALAGGAVLGTLLARWFDNTLTERVQERSERDRTRYAQGLAPIQFSQNNRINEGKLHDDTASYHDAG